MGRYRVTSSSQPARHDDASLEQSKHGEDSPVELSSSEEKGTEEDSSVTVPDHASPVTQVTTALPPHQQRAPPLPKHWPDELDLSGLTRHQQILFDRSSCTCTICIDLLFYFKDMGAMEHRLHKHWETLQKQKRTAFVHLVLICLLAAVSTVLHLMLSSDVVLPFCYAIWLSKLMATKDGWLWRLLFHRFSLMLLYLLVVHVFWTYRYRTAYLRAFAPQCNKQLFYFHLYWEPEMGLQFRQGANPTLAADYANERHRRYRKRVASKTH